MVSEHDGKDSLYRAIVVDDKVVGTISIEPKADVMRKDAELGYFLLTEYWSQGIMTEATRLICSEAFEKLDIARITGIVYTLNTASRRVLEKNGFIREGIQRKSVFKNGVLYDSYIYGKLREDNTTVTVDQMRRSDAYTIGHFVPSKELMYRAAYGVYRSYDGWQGKSIGILCGGGNNGGDGYALAGILKEAGIDSTILKVSDKLSEDGRYYCEKAENLGVTITEFEADTNLSGYDVLVDCILGTGFKGEVRGRASEAIMAINAAGASGPPGQSPERPQPHGREAGSP
jgi:hydroxyethylthiazole kinase-like uncharacterized protein yjeF